MHKPEVTSKLGIALENSPPGTYPKVRRVGADGAAAGVLEPEDVLLALDGMPLDVGTAAATEMLRSRTGVLMLTVRRLVPVGEDSSESESEGEGESDTEGESGDEPDEDWLRIKVALESLRVKAVARSDEGANAPLERATEETARLASALKEATFGGHQELLAKVVRKTEARCAKDKALAVEAATIAAARATEVRLTEAHALSLARALEAAAVQAKMEQQAAVALAIRMTEERGAEQLRLAVLDATSHTQSELGVSQEAVAASAATLAFREATASAGAALAAAMHLRNEQSARPVSAEEEADGAGHGNNLYFF